MSEARCVGFVGLGDIGEPMARNLVKHGPDWDVFVYDLRDDLVELLVKDGAKAAASNREIGERCDIIGVCVLDDAVTERVIDGPDGILEGAGEGTLIAIHSTIRPDTARKLGARAAEKGVVVVDAQMTGGRGKAGAGELRYMVGGEPGDIERVRPFLETSAAEITDCGALGNGAVAKLCNNLVQYQAWQAYVEAHLLAAHSGLEYETLMEVLSWIMNDNARLFLGARNALEADPSNDFLRQRYTQVVDLAVKDLQNALDAARDVGVSLPGTALTQQNAARICGLPPDQKRR